MRFHERLQVAFERRRRVNGDYSLRAFARALRIHHSTLSQILRGRRRITAKSIRVLGPKLGLDPAAIAECCALEHECSILTAITDTRFRPDSRWLSVVLNIPLDDVNVALQRLLRRRLLVMESRTAWRKVAEV
jgi:transcriptional regulator with XRE-family HTH domain